MADTALDRKVATITGHGALYGWTPHVDRRTNGLDGDLVELAVVGLARTDRHPDDPDVAVTWLLVVGLGLAANGRVSTLESVDHAGAKVVAEVVELDGRYWRSSRAGAWVDAARDPWAWVDKPPTAMEVRLAGVLDRLPTVPRRADR